MRYWSEHESREAHDHETEQRGHRTSEEGKHRASPGEVGWPSSPADPKRQPCKGERESELAQAECRLFLSPPLPDLARSRPQKDVHRLLTERKGGKPVTQFMQQSQQTSPDTPR